MTRRPISARSASRANSVVLSPCLRTSIRSRLTRSTATACSRSHYDGVKRSNPGKSLSADTRRKRIMAKQDLANTGSDGYASDRSGRPLPIHPIRGCARRQRWHHYPSGHTRSNQGPLEYRSGQEHVSDRRRGTDFHAPGLDPSYAEIRSTRYRRSFTLSGELDADNTAANLSNGVLTATIPLRAELRPRKVEVRVG